MMFQNLTKLFMNFENLLSLTPADPSPPPRRVYYVRIQIYTTEVEIYLLCIDKIKE